MNHFRKLRIIVGCEESQAVTKEFRRLGHEAYSCDILPESGGHPEWHLKGDLIPIAYDKSLEWDLAIFHPPCTYFSVAGNSWYYHPEDKELPIEQRRPHPRFPDRLEKRKEALEFFKKLADAPIPYIAIENPVGTISSLYRKPDQYVHPYYFGDPHSKKTGLWLKGLPRLARTHYDVEPKFHIYQSGKKKGKRDPIWHVETLSLPADERACQRSKTFPGLATAIAEQWSKHVMSELR